MTKEVNKEAKRELYDDVDALVGFYQSEGYINEFFQSEIAQTPSEWIKDYKTNTDTTLTFLR